MHFSWDSIAERTIDLYRLVIERQISDQAPRRGDDQEAGFVPE